VTERLKALREGIFGAGPQNLAPHWKWELAEVEEGMGLMEAYRWEAKNPHARHMQLLAKEIIELQNGRPLLQPGESPVLWVPKEDLDIIAAKEHGPLPPGPGVR
jgi:hypothetical protein